MAGSRYRAQASLGRGSFGEVHRALDTLTGDTVALKRIFVREPAEGLPDNVLRELTGLQLVQHENVVRLLDHFIEVRPGRVPGGEGPACSAGSLVLPVGSSTTAV